MGLQQLGSAGGNGSDLAISPDGGHVAFPCGGGNGPGYTIFDFSSSDLTVTFGAWNTGPYPSAAAFSPDSAVLVASLGSAVKRFDAGTHALLDSHGLPDCVPGMLSRVAVSPSGAILYAVCSNDNAAHLYWFVP